ncbi:hypothetical protein GCM10027258_02810 [Amycolatopsis stemonae]
MPAVVRFDHVELHLAGERVRQDVPATGGGRGGLGVHDEDCAHYRRVGDFRAPENLPAAQGDGKLSGEPARAHRCGTGGGDPSGQTFETLWRAALLCLRVSARRDKCTRADRPLIDDP